ncbi:hypothetical protein AAVH_01445 [Aphelenchoides avenae]|nr:hypothetical protein AAVH_01445 [Aphelenchus avenae]
MVSSTRLFLFCALTIFAVVAGRIRDNGTKPKGGHAESAEYSTAGNASVGDNPAAKCYDYRLAQFINTGVSYYSHDMGALSKYILDQIVRARYSGYWFVHAEMITNQRQGVEWQSVTNGDLFAASSTHGCYYHDTQNYIVVLRY